MQCPNCRKIEKGQWLYADGGRPFPELNIDDLVNDEDLYDPSYSETSMWCPYDSFAQLTAAFDDAEFLTTAFFFIQTRDHYCNAELIKKFSIASHLPPLLLHKDEVDKTENEMFVLDLPNLALECILEMLEPDGLCKMACVCSYLRDMCLSDHLWEDHMKKRWGGVIDDVAYKEWQLHIASKKQSNYFLDIEKGRGLMDYLCKLWPVMLVGSSSISHDDSKKMKVSSQPPIDSIVSCYRALETGKFWFPAQVFNRENGHVGFMLSCYDADLSYDSHTDTFQPRYPPHGRRAVAIETGVTWDRLRAPLVDNSPHRLSIFFLDVLLEYR